MTSTPRLECPWHHVRYDVPSGRMVAGAKRSVKAVFIAGILAARRVATHRVFALLEEVVLQREQVRSGH